MTLPISAADLFRFNPLEDRVLKARESLADAEQAADDAAVKAAQAPDDAKLAEDAAKARELVGLVERLVASEERELDAAKTKPAYLLMVPTYRNGGALEELAARIPPSPSDRKMFAAIKAAGLASGLIPADDPDLKEVEKALREAGGGVPEEKRGLFDELFERVNDRPEVLDVIAARFRYRNTMNLLRVRFYLKGIEGLPGAEHFEVVGALATEEATDIIPPDHLEAIEQKLTELRSLRGREGNSSGSPSPSRSSPKRTKTE